MQLQPALLSMPQCLCFCFADTFQAKLFHIVSSMGLASFANVQALCKPHNQYSTHLCQKPELQVPWGQMQEPLQQMGCMTWVSHLALQASTRLSLQRSSQIRSSQLQENQTTRIRKAVLYVEGVRLLITTSKQSCPQWSTQTILVSCGLPPQSFVHHLNISLVEEHCRWLYRCFRVSGFKG